LKHQVGIVAALYRYPVKSMLGEQVAELEIEERGAVGDRVWALRETATGQIVSAKKFPRMFDFRAKSQPDGRVVIRFPAGKTIHADDPDASDAISAVLGRAATIERFAPDARERAGIDPKTVFGDVPVEQVTPDFTAETLPAYFGLAHGSFHDSAPMHLLASGTLRYLAKLRPGSIFDPRRFRANILIDTGLSDDRFVEDEWDRATIVVGDQLTIVNSRPALRCVMTLIGADPTHEWEPLPDAWCDLLPGKPEGRLYIVRQHVKPDGDDR